MRRLLILVAVILTGVFSAEAQAQEGASEISQEKARRQLQLQGAQTIQSTDPNQAIKMLLEVTQESKRSDWSGLLQESAMLLAKLYIAEEQYRRAANAAEDAVEAARALENDELTLASLKLLQDIYEADGRSRRYNEVNEEYTRLKTALDLENRNEQYSKLEDTYVETTAEMQEIMKDLSEAEIAQRLLENTTLNLRNEKLETELELAEEARKVMALNAKNKAQRTRIVQISLVTIFIALFAAAWIWVVRNKRKQDAQQAFLKQQLLQKDKMATLGEMTAGVAHEIKNPLNFVNNFSEGSIDLVKDLQESLELHLAKMPAEEKEDIAFLLEELRQNAQDIHKQGKRADSIINGMMNHARGESSESSLADVNNLLLDSWELAYAGAAVKYPELKVELEPLLTKDLPDIRLIPQDMNRAFLNIFNNSLEAFSERNIEKPKISLHTSESNGQVLIRIRDNAGGVPLSIQKKVFNPFFTTKPTGKGNTGLGLSIAHDIVEKGHDGTIELKSDAKQTTEILIRLPLMTQ